MGVAPIARRGKTSIRIRAGLAAVVLFGVAGPAAFPARAEEPAAALERALAAPPAEQRKLLRELAAAGDVRAAARMIDLAMWDEMKDVPVGTPPIDAWLTATGEFGGMTAAQVHGCVEANWAARQQAMPEKDRLARIRTARDRMMATEIRSPALAVEVASWLRDFEPKDEGKARTLEGDALPSLEKPAQSLDALVRAAYIANAALVMSRPRSRGYDIGRAAELAGDSAALFAKAKDGLAEGWSLHLEAWCVRPDNQPKGDWVRAAGLYEKSATLLGEAGDRSGQGWNLDEAARCFVPDDNPFGDWARAASLYERAAAAYSAAGDRKRQAESLHDEAGCLRPNRNPAGSWTRAAALFERAAALAADVGDKAEQGRNLQEQARCLQPDDNPSGSWKRAAELFERAAALSAEAGDKGAQAFCLYEWGRCLRPEYNPEGDWTRAAELFERAAAIRGEIGEKAGRARSLDEQARCLRPDLNPAGDWPRAASLYEQAATLFAEARDASAQSSSLREQAICIVRGDRQRMTPEARALFEKAARLARDAGDEAKAKWAEQWIK